MKLLLPSQIWLLYRLGVISLEQGKQILYKEFSMNKYLEEYQKAEKEGKTETITHEIFTWDEEGQELAGIVKKVSEFKEGQYEQNANQYEIDTGEGVVSTVLGGATDKQLEGTQLVNKKIYIQFKGQKEIAGSKRVNLFKIKVW